MEQIKLIQVDARKRLEEIINHAWVIFANQYINNKYDINLEAPFQLHFASVIKQVGEIYCLKKHEIISVNLEVNMGVNNKNYIDILVSYFDVPTNLEYSIPIELKFKTKQQSAEDIGALEMYKDLYRLERLLNNENNNSMPFGYFFCITDHHLYIQPSAKGLRTVIATYDGYKIKDNFEYKYVETKTGKNFYEENGGFRFNHQYEFSWENFEFNSNNHAYFLKMRLDTGSSL